MLRKFLITFLALLSIPIASQAQVVSLSGTGESLKIKLAGAAAVTEPTYSVLYRQVGSGSVIGRTTGGTAVAMLTGNAGNVILVDNVVICNADTQAVTVTLQKVSASTTYSLNTFVIPSLGTASWSRERGTQIVDSNGQSLSTLSSGLMSNSIGSSTAAAGTTTSDAGVLPAGTATTYPTTAADGTKGVRVHASDKVTGRVLFIGNGVSNQILKVYAPSGGTINGAAGDAAFSSVSGKGVIIQCLNSTSNTWLAW